VPWKPGGLDTECEEHEAYLSKFREVVSAKLQALINLSLEEEPEIKARNKTVQVSKNAVHMRLMRFCDFLSAVTYLIAFEIFTAITMKTVKNGVFWDVTLRACVGC
jgi:hypothetical protein